MKKTFMILGLFTVLFGACKKETNKQNQQESQNTTLGDFSRTLDCTPENSQNYLDSTGYWHNQNVDYSIVHSGMEVPVSVTCNDIIAKSMERGFSVELDTLEVLNGVTAYDNYGYTSLIDTTSEAGQQLRSIIELIQAAEGSGGGLYCNNIKSIVTTWEADVITNAELSTDN